MKKLTTIAVGALFLTLAAGGQQAQAGNPPPPGDAFKCYPVAGQKLSPPALLNLNDQFEVDTGKVSEPEYICNPAAVTSPIGDSNRHYTCYLLKGTSTPPPRVDVRVTNILGTQDLRIRRPENLFCTPSTKTCIDANGESIFCPNED